MLEITIPEHIENIKEVSLSHHAGEKQVQLLEMNISELGANILIGTSNEAGISRREKILKLTPRDTDTLEERRYRVLINWYDSYPYTQKDLMKRLDRICGKDEYELQIDYDKNFLRCIIKLTSKRMFDEFYKLIDEILPLDVAIEVGLKFNQWKKFNKYVWKEMQGNTWRKLKEEVFSEEI